MNSLWNEEKAVACGGDLLAQRVYTSRLIGCEGDLVLHGGGNTSVKVTVTNIFGDDEEILYVKGSGWDLETIEREGFAPVRLNALRRMAGLEQLSDSDMVRLMRGAMTDPSAPTPSVEAILHAIIPARFVDHTHADAVVTITNTPDGMRRIGEIYGGRIFIVPYVMPGFLLSKEIHDMTRDLDWHAIEGMILLNHGVFTFGDDARSSYERMIQIVSEAEVYLEQNAVVESLDAHVPETDLRMAAALRRAVSRAAGCAMTARSDTSVAAVAFSRRSDVADIVGRGTLTPDHVIRTKRTALVVGEEPERDVDTYARQYNAYFERNTDGKRQRLDNAPRWALWPGNGTVSFGRGDKAARVCADIISHTIAAIARAESLDRWEPLGEEDVFDVEYWELEQAKLAGAGPSPIHTGKVAIVTGAASGIGRACAERLRADGAAVAALDINGEVEGLFHGNGAMGIACDLTNEAAVAAAIDGVVSRFGGIDILVSNAGTFPSSATIAETTQTHWQASLEINLTAHQRVLRKCVPFLVLGIDPAVVVIGSKNVAAPGYAASSYSVAKAGLTQLARVAALELAGSGIRVNVLHPNDVFDTAIWTDGVLESRAAHHGLSVDEYKTRNLLGVEISSGDVAAMVSAMAGPLFSKVTGAQIPIDGGNDRVL